MDVTVALILGLAVGAVIGAVATFLVLRARPGRAVGEDPAVVAARHATELAAMQASERETQASLREELAGRTAALAAAQDQVRDLQEQQRQTAERQRAEQQAREERERSEGKVLQALAPVSESLQEMRRKVEQLEQQRTQQHTELTTHLKSASEAEERLRGTAESLASALRSNSTRGVWGETQLRSVVEAAGLIERVDFDVQSTITSDAGVGRPDMIVHLPGGKTLAVDAKAPFTAFLEASSIPATATGAEAARRQELLKNHVKAVRDHITALSGRTYWQGLPASPEFVIAFIPNESLVSAALAADPSLMEYAFSRQVALASPVTLWSVLKTVAFTWQQDVLSQDAKKLFDASRELYSRLATLAGRIDKLGRSIKSSVNDYNRFVGSLERQVLPSARRLSDVDQSKVLPELTAVEETPRALTAPEMLAEPAGVPAADAATGAGVDGSG